MTKLAAGDTFDTRILTNLTGDEVAVPDPDRLVHLQFRRYAGCPICNTHLRQVSVRLPEIEAAGIKEVVVFHSSVDELNEYQEALPFDVIPDPEKLLYAEFDVEKSWKAVLAPKVVAAAVRGSVTRNPKRSIGPLGESHLGMPADFLIATDGRVLAAKYGEHGADQWSVDELLALAVR